MDFTILDLLEQSVKMEDSLSEVAERLPTDYVEGRPSLCAWHDRINQRIRAALLDYLIEGGDLCRVFNDHKNPKD
jgi:hypothetical protein